MADFVGSYPPPQPAKPWGGSDANGIPEYLNSSAGGPNDQYATAFDKQQYEKKQFLKQMILMTRADLKENLRLMNQDKANDASSARAGAEAAFDAMLASCSNSGQYSQLLSIRNDWIADAATGPIRSFSDYMSHWNGRIG